MTHEVETFRTRARAPTEIRVAAAAQKILLYRVARSGTAPRASRLRDAIWLVHGHVANAVLMGLKPPQPHGAATCSRATHCIDGQTDAAYKRIIDASGIQAAWQDPVDGETATASRQPEAAGQRL